MKATIGLIWLLVLLLQSVAAQEQTGYDEPSAPSYFSQVLAFLITSILSWLLIRQGGLRWEGFIPRTIRQALGFLVLFFLLNIALSIPLGILGEIVGVPLAMHPAGHALIGLVATGLLLRWVLKGTDTSFGEVFPLVPVPIALLLPLSITVLGMGFLLSEVDNLLRTILPMPAEFAALFLQLVGWDTSPWGFFLYAIIVAPLTEELIFRGLILRGFLSHYSVEKSILASALLFGAFHLNPWQFLGATAGGVLLGWLFVRTHSLLPCFFAHALMNAIPLVLLDFYDLDISGFSGSLTEVEFQPLWLDVLGLLLVGFGLRLLVQMLGKASDEEIRKIQ